MRDVTVGIESLLSKPAPAATAADVVAMRALIEKEKPPRDAWDLKLVPGGIIDLEFIAQYLVLRYAAEAPAIHRTATIGVLDAARRLGLLPADTVDTLVEAHRLFSRATQMLRIALPAEASLASAGEALKRRIAAATGTPDFASFEAQAKVARQAVRETFREVLSDG